MDDARCTDRHTAGLVPMRPPRNRPAPRQGGVDPPTIVSRETCPEGAEGARFTSSPSRVMFPREAGVSCNAGFLRRLGVPRQGGGGDGSPANVSRETFLAGAEGVSSPQSASRETRLGETSMAASVRLLTAATMPAAPAYPISLEPGGMSTPRQLFHVKHSRKRKQPSPRSDSLHAKRSWAVSSDDNVGGGSSDTFGIWGALASGLLRVKRDHEGSNRRQPVDTWLLRAKRDAW